MAAVVKERYVSNPHRMPHHDDADTDPSTPEARAALTDLTLPMGGARITPSKIVPVAPGNATAERAKSSAPTTDPGVAPPSDRGGARAARVVVPPARSKPPLAPQGHTPPMPFTAPKANDSIDVLLDGITGGGHGREKPRVTPETRGEASAAYDGEHKLLPKQPTPVPEESVIVARPQLAATLRIDRAELARMSPSPTPASVQPVMRGGEPTVVTPRTQGPRVVIALFSAILVVFGIFLVLKSWATKEKQKAMAADPSASVLINGKEPPPKAWTPNATVTVTATAAPATAQPGQTDQPDQTQSRVAPTAGPLAPATNVAPTPAPTGAPSPRPSGAKPKGTEMGELRPSINH